MTARVAALALLAAAILVGLLGPAGTVTGAAGDLGIEGTSYAGTTTAPTGEKPESKLWWNDGSWWGVLWASGAFRIHRLDRSSGAWVNTGVLVDARGSSRADALWDGAKLYVASHVRSSSPATGYPSLLLRYSYTASTRTYSLDAGFPAQINNERTETLVIDKDTTGVLWATWVRGGRVYVSHTAGSDDAWVAPFTPPVKGATNLSADDISSVVAFGPGTIGVMWSNQRDSAMYFATHVDGQPDDQWAGSRTAIQGPNEADDHINLKSLQADGSGRVYAAVKSSQTASAAPLIRLLVRDAGGGWSSHTFGRVRDHHTRPIVLLDDEQGVIHMFATSDENGGTIFEKTSPIGAVSFAEGLGTPVIRDASSADMNNATSTKQNVNSRTGLVILASNDSTDRYWHADIPLATTPPPTPTPAPTPSGTPAPTVTPAPTPTPPPTQAPSPTPPPGGTLSLAAVGDARTNSSNPTANYGASTSLQVRDGSTDGLPTYRSYVKFDVKGLGGPASSVVLRIGVTDATRGTLEVSATSSAWSESTITAANAPAPGSALASATGPIGVGTLDITLPASAVGGDGAVSFVLENSGTDSALFSSREGGQAPMLIVSP